MIKGQGAYSQCKRPSNKMLRAPNQKLSRPFILWSQTGGPILFNKHIWVSGQGCGVGGKMSDS